MAVKKCLTQMGGMLLSLPLGGGRAFFDILKWLRVEGKNLKTHVFSHFFPFVSAKNSACFRLVPDQPALTGINRAKKIIFF
jgi:hypothetical protein